MVNLKQYIEPTDVTFEWIINQLDGKDKKLDKIRKQNRVSGIGYQLIEGTGFLSYVVRVTLHFKGIIHSYSVILKVPTVEQFRNLSDDQLNRQTELSKALIQYHNAEIKFYKLVACRYNGLCLPKLLGFEYSDPVNLWHGRILLSDISDKACTVNNGLTIAQCCDAIDKIAKFHAFSRYTVDSDWIMNSMTGTHLLDLADDQIQLSKRLEVLHEEYFDRNMFSFKKLFETSHLQVRDSHLKYNIKPVLSHGDFWFKNILFKKDDKEKASNNVFSIIDWQNCHVGTGVSDIARFILTSTSAQVQAMCTDRFLKLYYETFQFELKKHGQEAEFSLEKLHQIYWFHYDHELIFALSYFSTEALKANDIYDREKMIQRMIAAFEPVRGKFDKN